MLDWLAVWGATQAVGLIFKPILEDLAKDAAKDWAKDLLKGIPGKILAKLKKDEIEIAAGKALKEFLQLMQQQLKVRCKLSESEIKEYTKDVKQFISDKLVKENIGKAFDINCEELDSKTLEDSWKRLLLKPLPDKFNWQSLTVQYLTQVQELLLESEELRSFLELQKLSSIDNRLKENADIAKDFNLPQYLETIRERYGNLKLDSLEPTSREHPINLWQIFITHNVREVYQVLPEIPKEYLRKLQASNQLDGGWEIEKIQEELEGYKRNYLQQPIRSVLDVIREKKRKNYLVILGDPGSGKSTLLQYLALDWVEQTLDQNPSLEPDKFDLPIPLLIELRNYVRDRTAGECKDFLEFYHKGANCFYHLNQHKLHQQLKAGNALVMFDGLDEIFDLEKREEVITCIHRFTNEYPDVQVIVTSRIIGYKQQALQDAEFRHFMLQDLETEQIEKFIERWHNRTFNKAEEQDKDFKQERLERAIKESQAIAELARNPLLLTMMAILNLKRELPRDRSELYKDASEVLLQNWDAGRNLKPDERLEILDYKDKQAMLRQVAYQMQTSDKGLAGNIIHGDDLEAIFRKYLQSIPVSDDRDKARRLMKQLRDRNFILCFMGADYYAFVHRTFLEYFCAAEFVQQFAKRGTANGITLEVLKTEVFGKHWPDETWHEVLLLIAGMIDAEFVGEILEYLMVLDGEEQKFINLFLAAKCLAEVRNRSVIASTVDKLLGKLKDLTKYDLRYYYNDYLKTKLVQKIRTQAVAGIAKTWIESPDTKTWLKDRATQDDHEDVRGAAVSALAQHFKDDRDTKTWLKDRATQDDHEDVQSAAVSALAQHFKDDPDTKTFLKDRATQDDDNWVRRAAVSALAQHFKDDRDTKTILKDRATQDDNYSVRGAAVEALAENFKDDPDTKTWLKDRATQDDNWDVRRAAVRALAENFKDDPDIKTFLKDRATQDDNWDVRGAAVKALAENFKDDPDTKTFLKDRATQDDHEWVRGAAVSVLAENFKDDPDTKTFLKDRATQDDHEWVRGAAVSVLAENFKDDPDTKTWLKDRATQDDNYYLRCVAVFVLAENFKDDPDTKTILKDRATQDDNDDVRRAAVQALGENFPDDPELFAIYYNCAVNHPFKGSHDIFNPNPRRIALEIIIKQFPQHPDTLPLLRDRAENDADEVVRGYAEKQLREWENE